jgi:hypothetical protein
MGSQVVDARDAPGGEYGRGAIAVADAPVGEVVGLDWRRSRWRMPRWRVVSEGVTSQLKA